MDYSGQSTIAAAYGTSLPHTSPGATSLYYYNSAEGNCTLPACWSGGGSDAREPSVVLFTAVTNGTKTGGAYYWLSANGTTTLSGTGPVSFSWAASPQSGQFYIDPNRSPTAM